MNKYMFTVLIVSVIGFVISMAVNLYFNKDDDKLILKKNKLSGNPKKRMSDSKIKAQLEKMVSEKADADKKFKIETVCMQSGTNLSYGEFKLLSIAVAITLPILSLIVLKNFFLVVVFAFIGYHIPYQVIKTMANRRVAVMEQQVGSFVRMVLERYKGNKDMAMSLTQTLPDFQGLNPFYGLLKDSVAELKIGLPLDEILYGLARKTGNKYLQRFADYYKITENIDTHEEKVELLEQAYQQYKEFCDMKAMLKEKISGPVREAYIMVCVVPIFMLYQVCMTEGYVEFMTTTTVGQIGLAGIFAVLLGCIWFINAKIGAPIE